MNELEKAAASICGVHPDWSKLECFRIGFKEGAQWQAKQSPWISVDERLPDENQMVLCQMKSNNAIVSAYIYKNGEGNPQTATSPLFEFEDYQGYEPIRWMSIPE
ncbi:DUF551 domain-containing protein [Bacteroides neonati]|uniref:DUF551 domain-containing protein n=1 Tax=Bacteroides neonati TaxID=1347393 RepID=UPI0004B3E49C|nr:DUF551 domain-containing protein [Bacteroides neonati]